MRQVVLDTETTGLDAGAGHRIIEIGCVEIIDRKLTGKRFHVYLNPERDIDAGAVEVHGLTSEFLSDKPRFSTIYDDFIAFVGGAELIIHNAPFDVGFLNKEMSLLDRDSSEITAYCQVLDTLAMARRKNPGQRNNLDALCKRYGIDNSHRELHGALLDAEILADVYLAMTGGQILLTLEPESDELVSGSEQQATNVNNKETKARPALRVIRCEESELAAHETKLGEIRKDSGGRCAWS